MRWASTHALKSGENSRWAGTHALKSGENSGAGRYTYLDKQKEQGGGLVNVPR